MLVPMKILHVVGARPNFMKAAPVYWQLSRYPNVHQILVHTGQHYDFNMSDIFFQQLRIPAPTVNLRVGSGSHAQQTADVMSRFEAVVIEQNPDYVLVYGDVNSTVAAALVCSKLGIKVAHVEAGLRSFDRTMPEEVNRLLTDQLSDLLFTPSEDGNRNLKHEGVSAEKVHLVGNVMIDTLIEMLPECEKHLVPDLPPRFAVVTLHRPANVDNFEWLKDMLTALQSISTEVAILFPVHPRTRQHMSEVAQVTGHKNGLRLLDPLPYISFLALQRKAEVVITDSGGIQEETTYLGTPCLTVRNNTERPVTVNIGTNILVGTDIEKLKREFERVVAGEKKKGVIPPLWDGKASSRIAEILVSALTYEQQPATVTAASQAAVA